MLGVLLNSASDGVYKGLGLIQASRKKGLEFLPDNGDVSLIIHLLLVLLPAKQGGILEESGGKLYSILTFGSDGAKMVLILLEEVIVLQVSLTPIHV